MPLFEKARKPGASEQARALRDLAARYEGKVLRAMQTALRNLRDDVSVRQVARLIEEGATDAQVFHALGLNVLDSALGPVTRHTSDLLTEAGDLTTQQAADGALGPTKVLVRFDSTDPAVTDLLSAQAGTLITGISTDGLSVIRDVLANGYAGGDTPIATARRLRDTLGLAPRQARALDNFREALLNGSARALSYNVGGNMSRVIGAGLRDDTLTSDKIDRLVSGYADRLVAQRAQTVAQTETFRALNAGAQAAWGQIGDALGGSRDNMRRFWVATNDERTRDAHLAIVDMNPDGVGLDEPFDSPLGPIMFPGDPSADPANTINCRCTVVVRLADVPEGALPPVVAGRSYLPGAADFTDMTD